MNRLYTVDSIRLFWLTQKCFRQVQRVRLFLTYENQVKDQLIHAR
ncbi:MAG: hypothetical protein GQF41_4172 [Candidatus Rifleibacterium amylolyticum]|nr:MAG: hypothetical protein GQF41_4172 [Candidatus Rifleibacterium amylolyticum]